VAFINRFLNAKNTLSHMKLRLPAAILLLFCCSFSYAQQTPATVNIKGLVVDSATNKPMDFVTVALSDTKTKAGVKTLLSKTDGSFEFTRVTPKGYQVTLAFVGYANKVITIDSTNKDTNLGKIAMAASTGQLKEVTISAVKPIIKQESDRVTYDVQADPESKALTALDMFRKIPLITVDATDNIKLKGNSNYKILINGKPSAMVARNPSDVFKSMPASNIERIEVITTPPAKYDAEGLAGIINVITKKNADQGYNGNISTRYNSVWGPGVNVNATVKQGKFGLNGYTGYGRRFKRTTAFSNDQLFIASGTTVSQNGERSNSGDNLYGSAELSYELDSLNLFTGNVEFYGGSNGLDNTQTSIQGNVNGSVAQSYRQITTGDGKYKGIDMGLNYQLGFKRNKDQLLTASYRYSKSPYTQLTDNRFFDELNYKNPDFQQYNNSGNREQTIQLDYVHPLKKLNIEAGAKGILRDNFSDFNTDTLAGTQYIRVPAQSNSFDYGQDVYSIYNSYQLKLKKWVFKGGLRLEHTNVNANFISAGSAAKQSYNNWVPSVSMQRTLKGNNSVTFGYSQRIQRPGIWQLNPFVDSTNVRFINVGNPDLRPVVNRSFELNYSNFTKGM
jgi:outer membrane receptor protein involved in Fe transport